jgi:hypothetical protein
MKTSVRTPLTNGTNANLIWDLMQFSGDRLILSAGYMYSFAALPFNTIANSVGEIDLVVGTWTNTPSPAAVLLQLQQNVAQFADQVAQECSDYGLQKPNINAYLVPQWHAKVALMVDSRDDTVTAGILGSSNISHAALGLFGSMSNVEADVLICSTDGPDAQIELNALLQHLKPTYSGHFYKKY